MDGKYRHKMNKETNDSMEGCNDMKDSDTMEKTMACEDLLVSVPTSPLREEDVQPSGRLAEVTGKPGQL